MSTSMRRSTWPARQMYGLLPRLRWVTNIAPRTAWCDSSVPTPPPQYSRRIGLTRAPRHVTPRIAADFPGSERSNGRNSTVQSPKSRKSVPVLSRLPCSGIGFTMVRPCHVRSLSWHCPSSPVLTLAHTWGVNAPPPWQFFLAVRYFFAIEVWFLA